MYFDELTIGMCVETAPAVIEKEKMLTFAREYDDVPLHTDEEYAKYWKDLLGDSVEIGAYGKVTYTDANGEQQVIEKEFTQAQYFAAKASKETALLMEKLPDVLSKASTAFNNLYKDDKGKALTRSDIKELTSKETYSSIYKSNGILQQLYGSEEAYFKANKDKIITQNLSKLYKENEELWKDLYGSEAVFIENMKNRIEAEDKAFENNYTKLSKILPSTPYEINHDIKREYFDSSLSAESEAALIEKLTQIVSISGVKAGKEAISGINNLLSINLRA